MKKLFLTSLILFPLIIFGQVGIGTTTPSAASMLEVSSTSDGGTTYKGFMPPRVPTVADRNNINAGAGDIGLLVFVQSTNCLQMWTGSAWEDVRCVNGGTNTEVQYGATIQPQAEDSGGVDMEFAIANPSPTNPITLTIAADSYTDIDESGPQMVVIPANVTTYVASSVFNITDDAIVESDEFVMFTITAVSGGQGSPVIGAWNTNGVTIQDNDGSSILAIQDFEIVPATPTYNYIDSGVGQLQAGNGSFPASPKYKSPDRGYGVQNGTSNMQFSAIDASSFSSCNLSFFLASFSGTSGNGADTNDVVTVSISVDGGTTYSDEMTIRGQGNAKWDFDGTGTAIINYDGDNVASDFQSANGAGGIATVQVNGIPNASDIRLRITMLNNAGNEIWVIDDVQMEGM